MLNHSPFLFFWHILIQCEQKNKHPFSFSSSCLPRWVFLEHFTRLWNLLLCRWLQSALSPGSFFLPRISCPSLLLPGKHAEDDPQWHFWYLAHPLHEGWFLLNCLSVDIDIHQYWISSFSDHVLAWHRSVSCTRWPEISLTQRLVSAIPNVSTWCDEEGSYSSIQQRLVVLNK